MYRLRLTNIGPNPTVVARRPLARLETATVDLSDGEAKNVMENSTVFRHTIIEQTDGDEPLPALDAAEAAPTAEGDQEAAEGGQTRKRGKK